MGFSLLENVKTHLQAKIGRKWVQIQHMRSRVNNWPRHPVNRNRDRNRVFSPEPKNRTGKQDRKIFDPNFKQENRTGFFYRKQDLLTGNRTGNFPWKLKSNWRKFSKSKAGSCYFYGFATETLVFPFWTLFSCLILTGRQDFPFSNPVFL